MKNYLKFFIAIFGVTVAIFSSSNVFAGPIDQDPHGICVGTNGICAITSSGNFIFGEYVIYP